MEVHHIFPKDLLYKTEKTKSIVNALANYSFLTKDTNLCYTEAEEIEEFSAWMESVGLTAGTVNHAIPDSAKLKQPAVQTSGNMENRGFKNAVQTAPGR